MSMHKTMTTMKREPLRKQQTLLMAPSATLIHIFWIGRNIQCKRLPGGPLQDDIQLQFSVQYDEVYVICKLYKYLRHLSTIYSGL